MTLKRITAPASQPITLADAKVHCRVDPDITAEDELITSLVVAATEECEHLLQRSLITQVWQRSLDGWPDGDAIELGMLPVRSVDSVLYIDTSGQQQAVPGSSWVLDDASELEAWVLPARGYAWPDTLDTANAVRVLFTTGYGDPAAVPDAIKTWIRARVATLYGFRAELLAGVSLQELPRGFIGGLLDRYRIRSC